MMLRNSSLSRLSLFLLTICVLALAAIIFASFQFTAFYSEYREETRKQGETAVEIVREIDQSLIPINRELVDIQRILGSFSSELALLSLDSERSFAELEVITERLGSLRNALIDHWPEGLLETALLERITSNLIISEDIALEVLALRNPNYTYQLYEESVEIIAQVLSDTESVLSAVTAKLEGLAAEGYLVVEESNRRGDQGQRLLEQGLLLFVLLCVFSFGLIIVLFFFFSKETHRRLNVLKAYAQAIESGQYEQLIDLISDDASGQLARSLESMSSRLVHLIQESEDLAERAQESSKAKSEFLASMSHEIRTPMNGVIGLLDIISASKLDAQQRQYLRLAQSSATSLLSVINDILDFSKIESGKLALEHVDFDVLELANEFIDVMSHTAGEKGLPLLFEARGMEQHGWINGDPSRLRQVLTNLVGNSLKFTHSGEINVLIVLFDREGQSWLRVEVRDTGIGIPEEKLSSLFESFTQVDASTTRRYGGTGLGLTISNQLVQLMGADGLHVESEQGEGSCFSFEFPTAVPEHPPETWLEENPVESHMHHRMETTQAAPKKRVLLVEDNAVNQVVAQTLIEAEGFEVEIANDGQQALDKLSALPGEFVMVFMDCQMPVMDGYAATRAIRNGDAGEVYAAVPIVAMTANAMQGDREKCIDAGMDDYISKPIDAGTLTQKLSSWSEHS
jgi:signal transduction histidine kinase/ActR/RegA family two-component response regulator